MRTIFITSLIAGIIITFGLLVKQITPAYALTLSMPNLKDIKTSLISLGDKAAFFLKNLDQDTSAPQPRPGQSKKPLTPAPTKSQPTTIINLPAGGRLKIKTNTRLKLKTPKTKRICHRYTVTHLDGSTSTLCYTQSDYNQLLQLGYKLTSAKVFYKFHLKGADSYQKQ
ncbi:MAG: hypothetical protein GXP43_00635, partial [bacterium]|nr:hypothetical protein [bacterium]